ncbi:MAG TPA: B12-binding domain-containing radical SAM protein [Bacillota bacterium]|nr:B12-binding domain-containing radical SAM protein [Bacillota bacterium]
MPPLFLFVRPPRPLWPFNSPASAFWPPLAFASLAAMLRAHVREVQVQILDAPAQQMGWRTLEAELHRRQPTWVGLGEEAVSCVEGLRLARLAKQCGAQVIAGGCFFGQVAPQALRTGLIDVVVHGEGELTLVELVEALRQEAPACGGGHPWLPVNTASCCVSSWTPDSSHTSELVPGSRPHPHVGSVPPQALAQVKGISFLRGEECVTTPPRPLLPDLDALPLPAYDLLPVECYGAGSLNHPRLAAIELGRGCFGSCDFCVLWRQMGRADSQQTRPQLRIKSPERLLEEIRLLVGRYHRGYLGWVDPCFNADPQVPGQVAELLLRDGLHLGQSAWVRTDALVRDARSGALASCVQAGLNEVYLGIERPDAASLTALHKTSGVDHARQALTILREQFPEVLAIGSFIYGLPGDSPATVRAIHRLAMELELDQFFFIPLTPLPGTSEWRPELWDPTGERFREFNFLPTGRPHGPHAVLERALLLSMLLTWSPARLRTHLQGLFGADTRKRRIYRRLHGRAAQFHLSRLFQALCGGKDKLGLVFPQWYES